MPTQNVPLFTAPRPRVFTRAHRLPGSSAATASGCPTRGRSPSADYRLVLLLRPDQGVVGSAGDRDPIAIVEYPTRAAFLERLADAEYRTAPVHCTAGLESTVLLATPPLVDASRA